MLRPLPRLNNHGKGRGQLCITPTNTEAKPIVTVDASLRELMRRSYSGRQRVTRMEGRKAHRNASRICSVSRTRAKTWLLTHCQPATCSVPASVSTTCRRSTTRVFLGQSIQHFGSFDVLPTNASAWDHLHSTKQIYSILPSVKPGTRVMLAYTPLPCFFSGFTTPMSSIHDFISTMADSHRTARKPWSGVTYLACPLPETEQSCTSDRRSKYSTMWAEHVSLRSFTFNDQSQ
jgi:hypothetical protein